MKTKPLVQVQCVLATADLLLRFTMKTGRLAGHANSLVRPEAARCQQCKCAWIRYDLPAHGLSQLACARAAGSG